MRAKFLLYILFLTLAVAGFISACRPAPTPTPTPVL
jgi:hypothetical protein